MTDSATPARRFALGRRPTRNDMLEGPIGSTLFLFALPVLGGNALQSLNGAVNAYWVSHSLGATAVAAISNANIIMFFLLALVFGVAMAANILVAQAVGAHDMAMVKRTIGTATGFFVALSVIVAVFGAQFTPEILGAMGTPPDTQAEATAYLRVIFAAMPFMYFFVFMQMAQRGGGDSHTPFYFMILAVVLDSGLNPLLIRGVGPFPRLGIGGSATATLIGQCVSLVAMMVFLYRRKSPLLLQADELGMLKPDPVILKALIVKGLPMGAQMLVISGAAVIMIRFVNHFGSITTAAYGAATQIWTYIQMPSFAIGASVSAMTAQNVGAKRWDRVGRIAGAGVVMGVVITGSGAILAYLLSGLLLRLFLPPASAALAIAQHISLLATWGFVFFNVTTTLFGVVRATGAVWAPLVILIVSIWLIRIPFAAGLIPVIGADAIWWSFPMGLVTSATLSVLYYVFGGWRKAHMLG